MITVPACNESKTLRKCVESILKEAKELGEDFRIVISEDGSTDGTDAIAKELDNDYEQVIHLHSDCRLGKGLALKRAFKAVEGDIYAFVDSDLATSMKYLPQLINLIREGNDLAFGSRHINGSEIQRDGLRRDGGKGSPPTPRAAPARPRTARRGSPATPAGPGHPTARARPRRRGPR